MKNILPFFIILIMILQFNCQKSTDELLIGFAGSISGKNYLLGVDGRNTVQLLINEINSSGGLIYNKKNYKLKLIIRDFESNDNKIVPINQELIDENVIVILGHFTSSEVEIALDTINKNEIILISPTATSDTLTGKKDFFYRSIMSSKDDSLYLSKEMKAANIKNLITISADTNLPYVRTYTDRLESFFNIKDNIIYNNVSQINFDSIKKQQQFCDGIFIISSSIDTGTIAQKLKINDINKPLFFSGWAGNYDVIEYGGDTVNGAMFVHQINEELDSINDFKELYFNNYKTIPSFGAIETYDAFQLIKIVIENGGINRTLFSEKIKDIKEYQSISGKITIDEFGDAKRDLYLKQILDKEIRVIKKIE